MRNLLGVVVLALAMATLSACGSVTASRSSFEDIGGQLNRYSTLVSYLRLLLLQLTGQFGNPGTMYRMAALVSIVDQANWARRRLAPDRSSANESNSITQRDAFAGTSWHKFVPARIARVAAPLQS